MLLEVAKKPKDLFLQVRTDAILFIVQRQSQSRDKICFFSNNRVQSDNYPDWRVK